MRAIRVLATCLLAISLPALLTGTSLRWLVNEPRFYQHEFEKYQVSAATGIAEGELGATAQALIDYFNSGEDELDIRVSIAGQERELFNEREIAHLKDVKGLIQLCYRVQEAAFAYLVLYTALVLLAIRGDGGRRLANGIVGGSALTAFLLLVAGAAVLLNFEGVFLQFHLVSFANELWRLDPARDYLIRLFPQGFFYDAALVVAGGTMAESMVLGGVASAYLALKRKRRGTR